jgi:hypothetical protein
MMHVSQFVSQYQHPCANDSFLWKDRKLIYDSIRRIDNKTLYILRQMLEINNQEERTEKTPGSRATINIFHTTNLKETNFTGQDISLAGEVNYKEFREARETHSGGQDVTASYLSIEKVSPSSWRSPCCARFRLSHNSVIAVVSMASILSGERLFHHAANISRSEDNCI